MRYWGFGAAALLLAACSQDTASTAQSADPVPAETVISGGTIYTGVETAPQVELVAVSDGRIVFAGSAEDGSGYIGETTRQIDLDGTVMFPGFTDAHAHLMGIGQRERSLNLEAVTSVADLQARLQAAAQDSEGLISGRGWIETHWPEARFPNRQDLDAVVSDRPVVLMRADGHAVVVNSAALEAAGISSQSEAPQGGEILRDADGEPTGMLIDTAMGPAMALVGEPDAGTQREMLELGAEVMASYGWTGVHDMSVGYDTVAMMTSLAGSDRFAIRNYVAANSENYDDVAAHLDAYSADSRVIVRAVKFYADGALGSRGAALLEPYSDAPESRGLMIAREEEAVSMMQAALRDGVQLAIHAIGDRGNRLILDWMETAFEAVPPDERAIADPRWRIEHAQIVNPQDLPRFAALGVIPSMQPSHAIGDLHFAPDRLGAERLHGAYAWQSMIDSGAIVAGGSDAPVERGEARIEFYASAVRQDLDGYSAEGWHREEAVSRQDALKMFTIWPAYASFREDELGTIEVGKLADFSVFDRDLMTVPDAELREARPVMTIVDGEVVWQAGD
ncbi:amidohydrolase [Marinicauda pacifica]|uniref:Amidohydrolase n=3 Tax=Marinicauda pacifica TaxID=1133559 RepID=A0A4S2HBA0_9PROT|nr:amidohydrolase [Marinicauda pacifica]TGY92921.1 amidohydrolase [Marinicauda pacifica]GGE41351.1 amidohydrolase [Marinicauda pacifica]